MRREEWREEKLVFVLSGSRLDLLSKVRIILCLKTEKWQLLITKLRFRKNIFVVVFDSHVSERTKQSVCIINRNYFVKTQQFWLDRSQDSWTLGKLRKATKSKTSEADRQSNFVKLFLRNSILVTGVPYTDIDDGGGAIHVDSPEGGQPGEVGVETSHWSRSVQILCSDWLRSWCCYASSLML